MYFQKNVIGEELIVYSTSSCPENKTEWEKRSAAINCNKTHGYTCLPNDKLTEIVEFCYTLPRIGITKGTAIFFPKLQSKLFVMFMSKLSCPDILSKISYMCRLKVTEIWRIDFVTLNIILILWNDNWLWFWYKKNCYIFVVNSTKMNKNSFHIEKVKSMSIHQSDAAWRLNALNDFC